MSLSRPVNFSLLKLPFLCIESVIKSWETFDIICFALLSKRMRQIVKHLKVSLIGIRIFLSNNMKRIDFGIYSKMWHFRQSSRKGPLVFQKDAVPLYASETDIGLESYTDGNDFIALKMAMEFLNEVFKCSVEYVHIEGDNLPELGDIGVRSTVSLFIEHRLGYARSQQLNLLLENLEVTGKCDLLVGNTENNFYCDPKVFKCENLVFWMESADWVTLELLCQFDVPQLIFWSYRFSVEDIVTYVTHWFNSENRKLEYVEFRFNISITMDDFEIDHLNPMPFCEKQRDRYVSVGGWEEDISNGKDILRQDGLLATLHSFSTSILFYIWHKRFPDAVQ